MSAARLVACILMVAACGGGGDGSTDASVSADGDGQGSGCNAPAGTGCGLGDKCSIEWETEDPPAGPLTCVPEGDKAEGDPCTVDTTAGTDDCQNTLLCWEVAEGDNRCAKFCQTIEGDTCTSGSCYILWGILEDFADFEGICL
jgi:hypothetical protein